MSNINSIGRINAPPSTAAMVPWYGWKWPLDWGIAVGVAQPLGLWSVRADVAVKCEASFVFGCILHCASECRTSDATEQSAPQGPGTASPKGVRYPGDRIRGYKGGSPPLRPPPCGPLFGSCGPPFPICGPHAVPYAVPLISAPPSTTPSRAFRRMRRVSCRPGTAAPWPRSVRAWSLCRPWPPVPRRSGSAHRCWPSSCR